MCEQTVYEVLCSLSNAENINMEKVKKADILKGSLFKHVCIYEYYVETLSRNIILKYSDPAMRARTDTADKFEVSEELVSKIKHKFEKAVI